MKSAMKSRWKYPPCVPVRRLNLVSDKTSYDANASYAENA